MGNLVTIGDAVLHEKGTKPASRYDLGLGVLNDMIDCFVEETLNGSYELTMTYPNNGKLYQELKVERVIRADNGPLYPNQLFIIYDVSKPTKDGKVTVKAEHYSYKLNLTQVKPGVSGSGTPGTLLKLLSDNLVDQASDWQLSSDISNQYKVDWDFTKFDNARQILGGKEGSLLSVVGTGEFVFDNNNVRLRQHRGNDSGIAIAYGVNLVDLTQEELIQDTWTSIYPYAKIDKSQVYEDPDDLDNERTKVLTLNEPYYLDSDNTKKFAQRRIQSVDISQQLSDYIDREHPSDPDYEDDDTYEPTQGDLKQVALDYMKNNKFGIPQVNLTLSFVDLSQTLEFNNGNAGGMVRDLGDTVHVIFQKLNLATEARVTRTKWNVRLKRFEEIELGDTKGSLTDSFKESEQTVQKEIKPKVDWLTEAVNKATDIINSPGVGHIKMWPSISNPQEMLIMDTDNVNTATKVWRWNMGGLGYSKNGYKGPFELAMTQDGSIVADFITTGVLKAIQIYGVDIQGSTITGNEINGNTIKGNDIQGNTITGGTIHGTSIDAVTMTASDFTSGHIKGTNIEGGTITGNQITGGTINGTDITGTSIHGGAIDGTTIKGGTITGSTINGGAYVGSKYISLYAPYDEPTLGGTSGSIFARATPADGGGQATMSGKYGFSTDQGVQTNWVRSWGAVYIGERNARFGKSTTMPVWTDNLGRYLYTSGSLGDRTIAYKEQVDDIQNQLFKIQDQVGSVQNIANNATTIANGLSGSIGSAGDRMDSLQGQITSLQHTVENNAKTLNNLIWALKQGGYIKDA